ncbi:RNA polymerase-associated factor, partial [Kappamyces sp. JEL0829]
KPGQEFAFNVRYKNDLPAVPFDPKLLAYPHPKDRLYAYKDCTILKEHTYGLIHPDGEQGLPCTSAALAALARAVTHPDEKLLPRKDLLDPKDVALLARPVEKKTETKEIPNVPWLRRTEYISTEKSMYGRRTNTIEMGMSVKNEPQIQSLLNLTVDQQIERIELSFAKAQQIHLGSLKHPKNKDLHALEMFPIFPDFENWPNPYFLASYDENPLGDKKELYTNVEDQDAVLEESILKPLSDPENPQESWLAYYAPTADALEKIKLKRKLEELGRDDYEHDFTRDFDPQVAGTVKLQYPFFMEMRKDEGGAFYHPIQTQMRLKKRRAFVSCRLLIDRTTKTRPTSKSQRV